MSGSRLRGLRVLVVEDEAMIAMLLEDMLGELGCALAAVVGRPAQALEAIDRGDVEAAVLDVNLSGGTSDEVAKRLMALGLPYVLATGADPSSLTLAEHRGRPVVRKPFHLEGLAAALLQALDAKPDAGPPRPPGRPPR